MEATIVKRSAQNKAGGKFHEIKGKGWAEAKSPTAERSMASKSFETDAIPS